jgi:tRNA/tmRNA/rRNA uracil-C5-methylase (TrmA/RlmC/RlmD family)
VKKERPQKVFEESLLEPREHAEIYAFLQKKVSEAENMIVASHLNYLIIRGNYKERSLIFNVDLLNGAIVRRLKILAGQLQKLSNPLHAAFVYLDPSKSGYYLESKKADVPVQFKKLFGPALLAVEYSENRLQFHPTSFSQVNESMVPVMLEEVRALISPQKNERLIDLYCGYGLFSCFLGSDYQQVLGVDAEGPSIQSAKTNAKYTAGKANIRFLAKRITPDTAENLLPKEALPESIILDPPKQGPEYGVIEALCQRKPGKVLHIFCGVDQIPPSIRIWLKNDYQVARVVPLDMFPGTLNLEVLILLRPSE